MKLGTQEGTGPSVNKICVVVGDKVVLGLTLSYLDKDKGFIPCLVIPCGKYTNPMCLVKTLDLHLATPPRRRYSTRATFSDLVPRYDEPKKF